MKTNLTPFSRNEARVLGSLLAIAGVFLNKWSIERVVAPDEHLQNPLYVAAIVAFQTALLFAGLWLLLGKRVPPAPTSLGKMLGVAVSAGILIGLYGNLKAAGIIDPNRELRSAWDRMVASEELIVHLERKMKKLSASAKNLRIPDHLSREFFQDEVSVHDVADAPPHSSEELSTGIAVRRWALDDGPRTTPLSSASLWRSRLEEVLYFDNTKFYTIRGRFPGEGGDAYQSDVGFKALARTRSGTWQWIQASLKLSWRKQPGARDEASAWRIESLHTESFETMDTEELLFTEVLDGALAPADVSHARRNRHEELVRDFLLKKEDFAEPNPWFYIAAVDRHPGLSIVDLDRDGFDDVYVMERETRNMLFRNRGDGTFEEIAAEVGLDVSDFTSSALFADFDNDGDSDVFLGRTLERSLYLENRDGRFVDRSAAAAGDALPYLVSSVSAVDYDGDGLLDVYFSTYAAQMVNASEDRLGEALGPYLPSADVARLRRLLNDDAMGNKRMNFPGPPNVLLRNLGGGRFAPAEEAPELRVFRNTYQSTWADYDGDGDADVYLANDFAPNNLIRNEGNGSFADVTEETGTADIGFGMGAAWGDYDNDGKQDLYVSNMFSKAGQRITAQLDAIDPRFAMMAKGNSLFHNRSDRFEKVSGTAPPALLVEAAGWSWGGQFLDVDNNGLEDIFAVSGHYSAPKEVDADVDI